MVPIYLFYISDKILWCNLLSYHLKFKLHAEVLLKLAFCKLKSKRYRSYCFKPKALMNWMFAYTSTTLWMLFENDQIKLIITKILVGFVFQNIYIYLLIKMLPSKLPSFLSNLTDYSIGKRTIHCHDWWLQKSSDKEVRLKESVQ